MTSVTPGGDRRAIVSIRETLRELSLQLSLLNRQVGAHLELKDVDLDCLDLVNAHGPLTPSALARRAGLHPATLTGVLDRLERGGWVVRERDPEDRRAVQVRAVRERNAELLGLFAGMNASLDQICGGYEQAELELIAGFLRRTADAGVEAVRELAGEETPRRRR
ncbi:MarR family winged helix-turn-helix transcriptional regulator [Spirillospora sp. NPDC048911]|uniref:MarR family winged helix-turn-helix transcriptional regulator n=1 Tax=Spirillospora sp. NPDC048911 TaxID=3364527 RepID=UPI003710BDB0